MSDMLEKLIGLEKSAAALITEAEAEAARRKAAARAEAQNGLAELMKRKAAEGDAVVAAEKARIAAERVESIRAYKEKLAGSPQDRAAFSRTVRAFIEKGGA